MIVVTCLKAHMAACHGCWQDPLKKPCSTASAPVGCQSQEFLSHPLGCLEVGSVSGGGCLPLSFLAILGIGEHARHGRREGCVVNVLTARDQFLKDAVRCELEHILN